PRQAHRLSHLQYPGLHCRVDLGRQAAGLARCRQGRPVAVRRSRRQAGRRAADSQGLCRRAESLSPQRSQTRLLVLENVVMKISSFAGLAALLLSASSKQIGDWVVNCTTIASPNPCEMAQGVADKASGTRLLNLSMVYIPAND